MSYKLESVDGTTRYFAEGISFTNTDVICIKKYGFNDHVTEITDVTLNTYNKASHNAVTVDITTAIVSCKVWLTNNGGNIDLSIENASYNPASVNNAIEPTPMIAHGNPLRAVTNDTQRFNIFINSSSWWKDGSCYIWATYGSSGAQRLNPPDDLTTTNNFYVKTILEVLTD